MGRWFWGILLLAIASLILSLFGPWNANKRSAEMKTSISNALNANGYDFANIDMSGNVATLSGEAPSDELMNQAVSLASNTECETCKRKNKIWHVVKSDMTVKKAPALPLASPYVFNATKAEDGRVVLDGYVRNEPELNRVVREAGTLFGTANVENNVLKIARGAPDNKWGNVLSRGLQGLNALDYGRMIVTDNDLLLTGFTTDVALRDQINTGAANLPAGYVGATNIRVEGAQAANVGQVNSEGVCQSLFDDIKKSAKIRFAVDKAEIVGAASYDLLNSVASAAQQCGAFNVAIEGHTDSDGNAEYNQWLSEARANTVLDYLANNGVELSRMTAIGFGEAQPVASNDTPEGKSRNRRIEFTVTKSE